MQETLDMKLAKDRLFNPSLNNFRGGGDAVGAALANFINARENARARAVRNEELRRRDAQAGMRPNGSGQTPNAVGEGGQASWGSIFNMDNNGIDSMPQGYTEGTPITATGDNSPSNAYQFNESEYVPSAENGYLLKESAQGFDGTNKPFQEYAAKKAIYGIGANGFGDNTMNIRDQGIGQNYNQRINSQVGSFYPQAPNSNVNSFGSVFQNADKSNAITVNPNFQNPSSDNVSAPTGQGQPISGADNTTSKYDALMRGLANADYLDRQYTDYNTWSDWANQSGVDDEASRRVLYAERVQPLIEEARQERLRENYRISNDPNVDEQTRMQARAALAYDLKKPDLVNELQRKEDEFYAKQGMIRNPNYSSNGGSSAGNNILSALGDYEEGEQWMSPDGTGNSRTQCSNWVSDVLRKAGIKGLGHANGDELMRQFGNAYHEGLDGIQPGDVLNFKDHVGIYAGNGQYVARNSSGGVHQGSMEEAIQYFGQPLGYGSVGEYTGTSLNQKYIKDPNAMTKERLLGLRHKYNMEEIAARNAYRNKDNGTTVNEDGYVKGSGKRNNSLINGINWYANNKDSAKAEDIMKNFVDPMSEVFVDKLIQFKNEGDALEQLAYELVGGEKYGSSGMSDDALAEVISEAAMKAGNSERIRYTFSGKNAIKQKLLKDILPRLHGTTPSTEDGASGEKSGTKTGDGKIKPKKYNPGAKGGSSSSNRQKTLEEHKQDDPHYDDNGDNLALRQDLQQNGFARVFGRYVPQKYPNYDEDLN